MPIPATIGPGSRLPTEWPVIFQHGTIANTGLSDNSKTYTLVCQGTWMSWWHRDGYPAQVCSLPRPGGDGMPFPKLDDGTSRIHQPPVFFFK
jgi:hypothetical protein